MKFILTSVAVFAALFAQTQAQTSVSVSFDQTYDNSAGSTLTVACSDGPNGLANKFPTFGSFPDFPNIGGSFAVSGFGSANCGTCWELEFQGNTVNVLAIDVAPSGFNIALAAMNTLTNGQAEFLGRVTATATQVATSACGL